MKKILDVRETSKNEKESRKTYFDDFTTVKEDINEETVRKTIIIEVSVFDTIQDHIYNSRIGGDIYYNLQDFVKSAIEEKIKSIGEIKPRPEEIRVKEQLRKKKK